MALSVGSLVSAIGFSTTAARQVDADLAATAIDLVTIEPVAGGDVTGLAFPEDADARVAALESVVAAGRRIDVTGQFDISARVRGARVEADLALVGMTSGYLGASCPDEEETASWVLDTDESVVYLGRDAARALGVPLSANPAGYSVVINGARYSVAGFACTGSDALANLVALPYALAVDVAGGDADAQMLVRTSVGAGAHVAQVVRVAIRPDAPGRLHSSQVIDPASVRMGVSTQLGRLAGWIGGLLLALTVLLIANAMTVSVLARTTEIGVRRAIGAGRGFVAGLFLAEGAVIGMLGGATGTAVATFAIVGVSLVNQWTPVLAVEWMIAGPALGAVVGLLSTIYPAFRAMGIQPALAVRSD
ncbi:FtsX-like permease family protein [Actinotalea sp. C106]|uniref:ABC transporter permease n=1 Tax=Actinotalea sp. C106 TaxID=2908644 RepID=UPI00202788D3|nr:FtsX-like permease family protein [Actinotalea sp. C106]